VDWTHASLAHANRNFHHSQARRSPHLKVLTRDRNTPHKHVWRAEIVLLSADGVGTNEIMRRTGKSKTCVWRWQERFMQAGWRRRPRSSTAAASSFAPIARAPSSPRTAISLKWKSATTVSSRSAGPGRSSSIAPPKPKCAAPDSTMSVLENLPSLIDRPRRSRRRHRPDQAKPTSSSSSLAPTARAPSSPRTGICQHQSASLIGRSGSSAFRLSTITASMSLAGSCFSSESAPRLFHHGFRGRDGTI
jgi:hypothetical protein